MDYNLNSGIENVTIIDLKEVDGHCEIIVGSTSYQVCCPTCQTPSSSVKDRHVHRIIDRPIGSLPMHLFIRKRRFFCLNSTCPTKSFTEQLPGLKKHHIYTDEFKSFLENMYKHMDLPTIKNRLRDNYHLEIPQSTLHYKLKDKPLEAELVPYPISTKYVGLDEFSYLKWHTFGVILEDLVRHKTIDMVAGGKTVACAKAVLSRVVAEVVEGACIDMWEAFKIACMEMLPDALIVVDKFHVVKLINQAIENVRKRLAQDLPEEQASYLFRNRFLLLKGKERLEDIQRAELTNLLKINKELAIVYEAKENIRNLYQIKNTNIAYPEFRRWIIHSQSTKIPELTKVAETYSEWFTFIFNYWKCPINNAITEGKINKIRVLQTKAYQFRRFHSLRYHMLREDWGK